MNRIPSFLCLIAIFICGLSCQKSPTYEARDDFRKYYDGYHVSGSFVLYDLNRNNYLLYNREQFYQPFTPASTFKICNSLIGLETGVLKDANFVIPWDSVARPMTAWNRDHNLRSAFQNSVVPYYQEVARRVGGERMKEWLDKAHYGNADTTGGIDRFWLDGGLRITPAQQVDFLERLYRNELPFSARSMEIVKEIMIVRDSAGFKLRAKTGRSEQDGMQIGWYVGYLERKGKVYVFSNCIQSSEMAIPDFMSARIVITYRILTDLGLMAE